MTYIKSSRYFTSTVAPSGHSIMEVGHKDREKSPGLGTGVSWSWSLSLHFTIKHLTLGCSLKLSGF